ncbi:MAG: MATE family efflux transporter [Flavobacteriaceae bacterium]|nr:MATE family efflux transporter [Flavobacteriaceae bacterium]MCY4267326.1 MATE family efflux transporter [Flavobacteriaceae bacterium]MCY4297785.1 MATE family efflux transporter [Flavobacteriaceae bacterium]
MIKGISLHNYTKEFPYNLKLAYPVIFGMVGHVVVQLVDNIMVGQLGPSELAAISLGNSYIFIALSIGLGFSTAITPLVAESHMTKRFLVIRLIFSNGLIMCFSLGILLGLTVFLAHPILYRMGQPPGVVDLAIPYLKWVSFSLIPLITFQAFKQFFDGLSKTLPAMYATILANILNVLLNYFLIFGVWIFPQMGIEGAAIGTFISRVIMVIFMILYMIQKRGIRSYLPGFNDWKFQPLILNKLLSIGYPSALQMLCEFLFFISAIWLSGILGELSQAANQIALNLTAVTYMFAIGIGVAATIRVGNYKGVKNFKDLKRVAHSIFLLIIMIDIVFCLVFLVFRNELPWIYLNQNSLEELLEIQTVVALASQLLLISSIFQIFDGMQAVILGALRGLQDVKVPALICFIAYGLVGFPISYFLGMYTSVGVMGIWVGLLAGLSVSSSLLYFRFNLMTRQLILFHSR